MCDRFAIFIAVSRKDSRLWEPSFSSSDVFGGENLEEKMLT
jgi:hypothetical protein